MSIQLTDSAVTEIKRMLQKENQPAETGLRIFVKGGGCSGFSYVLSFDTPKDEDQIFEFDQVRVFADTKSYAYLKGMTMDYADGLQDKGFKFSNPNANKTCSCGESFGV